MKKSQVLQYLNDYNFTIYKSPLKNLYYTHVGNDNTKFAYIIDLFKSEKIEYGFMDDTITFILGKLGTKYENW